jgi:hypothetical protein
MPSRTGSSCGVVSAVQRQAYAECFLPRRALGPLQFFGDFRGGSFPLRHAFQLTDFSRSPRPPFPCHFHSPSEYLEYSTFGCADGQPMPLELAHRWSRGPQWRVLRLVFAPVGPALLVRHDANNGGAECFEEGPRKAAVVTVLVLQLRQGQAATRSVSSLCTASARCKPSSSLAFRNTRASVPLNPCTVRRPAISEPSSYVCRSPCPPARCSARRRRS